RLENLSDHKEAITRSFLYSSPRSLYKTVDTIWRNAGDSSVDFNFYTKRMLLTAVLTSTTTFWLADKSEGHEETWAFLDRRIENVMQIPKLNMFFQSKIEKCLGRFKNKSE
ncbi:MAG: COQ9 family protein, partial [Pseudomonadota bacterium]|nr:COQ9 family protein [Pseudomonadota bacterium]